MAYLVRKINKKKNIDALRGDLKIDELTADMPTGELRTTNGTLSTWIVESLSELNEAVLAIAVTSSKVSKMDFLIIDTEILNNHNLEFKQTYAGRDIPIPGTRLQRRQGRTVYRRSCAQTWRQERSDPGYQMWK